MVFGIFKKKGPSETAMDALIRMTYGSVPPPKTAVLDEAVELASHDLLAEAADIENVQQIAASLDRGPMPYSTHDLAVSTALNIFKNADGDLRTALLEIEEIARIQVQNWLLERKVAPLIAKTFNDTLLKIYSAPANQASPTQVKGVQEQLTAEFAKAGINFMNLHPTIHRTLLREAVMFGRIERTVEMFVELAEQAQREGRNDTARAALLLKMMEKRAALLGL